MNNISNRDIQRLYDKYNPNKVTTGDRVLVQMGGFSYSARIVGLDLDLKNQKVFANLKLVETTKKYPIRVDVADCVPTGGPIYPGHHNNGEI